MFDTTNKTNTNVSADTTPNHSTPEDNGGQGTERLFTQDEVNAIVGERLARERAKAEPSPLDERERDLKAREERMSCREYITEMGFPAKLLDILDTSDSKKFKATVEALDGIVQLPSTHRKPLPRLVGPIGMTGGNTGRVDALAAAFKPPRNN